jgi:hypothetical protein
MKDILAAEIIKAMGCARNERVSGVTVAYISMGLRSETCWVNFSVLAITLREIKMQLLSMRLGRLFFLAFYLFGASSVALAAIEGEEPEKLKDDGGAPSIGEQIGAEWGSGTAADPYGLSIDGSSVAAPASAGNVRSVSFSQLSTSLSPGSIRTSLGSRNTGYVGTRAGAGRHGTTLIAPAAENNSDTQNPTNPNTCNPVVLSSGEKYKDEVDFSSVSEYGLSRRPVS